ncbi:MAG: hypothetical protein U1E05_04855 [Patescibacteria group bacterium]|nr:hypothetical protein [Patescibacteria group bacterium]
MIAYTLTATLAAIVRLESLTYEDGIVRLESLTYEEGRAKGDGDAFVRALFGCCC